MRKKIAQISVFMAAFLSLQFAHSELKCSNRGVAIENLRVENFAQRGLNEVEFDLMNHEWAFHVSRVDHGDSDYAHMKITSGPRSPFVDLAGSSINGKYDIYSTTRVPSESQVVALEELAREVRKVGPRGLVSICFENFQMKRSDPNYFLISFVVK